MDTEGFRDRKRWDEISQECKEKCLLSYQKPILTWYGVCAEELKETYQPNQFVLINCEKASTSYVFEETWRDSHACCFQ